MENYIFYFVLGILLIINIFSFFTMASDKTRATRGKRRISEGRLLFLAIAFGALGIWLGMYVFRHKTRRWMFVLGAPLAIFENAAVLWKISDLLNIGIFL